jgi:transcriptional regulator with XRE-family HTH domain
VSDVGNLLREARQEKGVGLNEVAAATRIKASFLSALEDGDYSLLPGPAYITGFLRNYAAYLGLHPDDVVQEYYATRPQAPVTVKAATRVLASGYHRQTRSRLYWIFGVVAFFLISGYAIKQYNDSTAHAYQAAVNVTASGLSGTISPTPQTKRVAPRPMTVQLKAIAPVWVRVTVDNHQVFQGFLRVANTHARWTGRRSIYVVTLDGAHIQGFLNGRPQGLLSDKPGLMVDEITRSGWQRVS